MINNVHRTKITKAELLILNSSGNSTKTTTGKGLIKQRLQKSNYYKVCNSNENIESDEIFVTPSKLSSVHEYLMQSTSAIVEVDKADCE